MPQVYIALDIAPSVSSMIAGGVLLLTLAVHEVLAMKADGLTKDTSHTLVAEVELEG